MKLIKGIKIYKRNIIKDSRGWFLKVLEGNEENLPNYTGEIYVTSAKPNEYKGGHYHLLANEWFTIIKGESLVIVEDIISKEIQKLTLSATSPITIYVPAGIAHIFKNNSKEDFILLAYTDQVYMPNDTITYEFNINI